MTTILPVPLVIDETLIPKGLSYGLGVFTTFLLPVEGEMFAERQQFERLNQDCEWMGWPCPWLDEAAFAQSRAELQHDLKSQLPAVVRLMVTTEAPPFTHAAPPETSPQVLIQVRSYMPPLSPKRLMTHRFSRPFPGHKHVNYLAEHQAWQKAHQQGWDDVVRLTESQGYLSETTRGNLVLIQTPDRWLTPDCHTSECLPGIYRHHVLTQAPTMMHINIETGSYLPSILETCQGAFITNAVYGAVVVSQIDHYCFDTTLTQTLVDKLNWCLPIHGTP